MSPRDTGDPFDSEPRKRMLPPVTEVVRELAKTISADPAVLFKAARSVVAEELKRVKQGLEAAPIEVLVKRARLQLEREEGGAPAPEPAAPPTPYFPPRPPARDGPAAPPAPAKPPVADDPFQDTTSRAELNWEKDLPIQPEDAPFRSAILPIPSKSRGPLGIPAPAEPARDRSLPSPPASAPVPSSGPLRPPPGAAPLEERPTESLKPLPRPAVSAPPSTPLAPPRDPDPWGTPTEQVPATPRAAFERFLKSPAAASPATSAPTSPPTPPPAPQASGEFLERSGPREAPEPRAPSAKSMSEMPPLSQFIDEKAAAQPAIEEFHFKGADPVPMKPPGSARRGWLVSIALVLAVGAGLAWAVREYVFRNETVKGVAPAPGKKPEPGPAATPALPAAPTPAGAAAAKGKAPVSKAPATKAAAAPPPRSASASPAPSSAPVAKGRAALLLTPDWAGKATVYVIHFSSTKDRESAAKEAVKLAAAVGAPARAVEVDLGEKGVWYRVVVGEFHDVDAARAFRAELEAKKTPGMGFVYEMRGR